MKERILIIEDEAAIREILVTLLEDAGYTVATAVDGLEGVALFQAEGADLVLLDIMLPKIDGYAVCEWLRQRSNVPVVMLTALDAEEAQLRAFAALADDYITKPFSLSLVLARPVLALSAASARMARLDWTARCEEGRRDELGLLAHNLMAERLDAAMQALEADVDEIAALSAQQREFFAAASHELKTPLTILRGQLESMQLGLGCYRNTQAVLPEALAEVARMERLVAEILTLVKLERADAWTQTPLDLSALTVEVCTVLAPLAEERGMDFRCALAEDVWVRGNAALLEKAWHNIIDNALRHSPPGALVQVRLEETQFSVKNSGAHLPNGEEAALFRPFSRATRAPSAVSDGSGLGLALTATILERHGLGYVLTDTGEGVVFRVWLEQNQN